MIDPASLPERLADAEGELPEEIAAAIEIVIGQASAVIHEAHEGSPESMMRAVARKEQARTALTATILARLTAAESAREAAVARAERLEEALRECLNQIEYEHGKFGGTGSGETVLYRTRALLAEGAKP